LLLERFSKDHNTKPGIVRIVNVKALVKEYALGELKLSERRSSTMHDWYLFSVPHLSQAASPSEG
jgi:hypothetical protein